LAEQKECRVEEGHLMSDHVHMLVSIPPKHAVSQVVGYLKGKDKRSDQLNMWKNEPPVSG
jgi:REP element-mobilizing transposase RayT